MNKQTQTDFRKKLYKRTHYLKICYGITFLTYFLCIKYYYHCDKIKYMNRLNKIYIR